MRVMIQDFLGREDGATTVDWVALTAAIVGLGLVIATTLKGGIMTASLDIVATLGTLQTVFAW